jgi:hypothetical protein
MAKHRVGNAEWDYPHLGGGISVPLGSADRREHFVVDLRRGRIDPAKGTYQNRGRQVVVLVRLAFGGAPHRNPDGEEIGSPHLHSLEGLGYSVFRGPEIVPYTPGAERSDPGYRDVLVGRRLRQALVRFSPDLPSEALEEALHKLTRADALTLESLAQRIRVAG